MCVRLSFTIPLPSPSPSPPPPLLLPHLPSPSFTIPLPSPLLPPPLPMKCVKSLLFHTTQCDVNVANEQGDTPLHNAARWGYGEAQLPWRDVCTLTSHNYVDSLHCVRIAEYGSFFKSTEQTKGTALPVCSEQEGVCVCVCVCACVCAYVCMCRVFPCPVPCDVTCPAI